MLVHATTLDIAGLGILILGDSGAGKSDLALRLVADGALLVADDQTLIETRGDEIWARAPDNIAGLIEARGVGIVPTATKRATRLALTVQLTTAPERMPERRAWSLPGAGPQIPLIELNPFEASAPAKLRLALAEAPTSRAIHVPGTAAR
jgi:serine kinase of HPr protein (carbohydrate metabolism regulator)